MGTSLNYLSLLYDSLWCIHSFRAWFQVGREAIAHTSVRVTEVMKGGDTMQKKDWNKISVRRVVFLISCGALARDVKKWIIDYTGKGHSLVEQPFWSVRWSTTWGVSIVLTLGVLFLHLRTWSILSILTFLFGPWFLLYNFRVSSFLRWSYICLGILPFIGLPNCLSWKAMIAPKSLFDFYFGNLNPDDSRPVPTAM